MTLLERQNLYAKSRSNSEEPRSPRTRSVSPAPKSPAKSPVRRKPPPVRKPISRRSPISKRTASKKRSSFNDAGKKRLDEKFADTDDYDDDRVPTPPGKKRVAFRGQYIFVTDDEYDSDDDSASKASTAKSRRSVKTVNKSPSRYSSRSRISEEDEEYYDSESDDNKKKS